MVKRLTPKLDALFARIKTQTKMRGKKTTLAASIGVTLQTLNDWTSGRYEPGGEPTLQLLEWVQAAEAREKKDPERASTRPRQMTRKKKSITNEKPKSSQSKG